MTALRLALIGAGGIGSAYAQAADAVDEVTLAYVADAELSAATALAGQCHAQATDDPLSLANPRTTDLALICTPPSTHEDLCISFLRAGIPVMCEKPLAPDLDAARRILAVAIDTGTPLTMASKFRFVRDVAEARTLLSSGALGQVLRVEVAFASHVDMSRRWNSDPTIAGGGVVIDNGTHAADIVRYLLGPVDQVIADLSADATQLKVEDTGTLLMRTTAGQLASVDVSWSMDRMTQRYIAVFGTKGSLEICWNGSKLRLKEAGADVTFGEGYGKLAALGSNLRNVARSILGHEDLVVSPADAIASVAVVDAAYRSAASGRWESVHSRRSERLSA